MNVRETTPQEGYRQHGGGPDRTKLTGYAVSRWVRTAELSSARHRRSDDTVGGNRMKPARQGIVGTDRC